jgi:hypothetical protein
MFKKDISQKNVSLLLLIFALWMALIIGCSNADKSNSSQPLSVSSPSPKAVSTPLPATPEPAPSIEGKITREEYGAKWAFSVDEGVLACDGKNGVGAVTFASGGKIYAVNGVAKQKGLYQPLELIWVDDPSIKGAKKNLGDIIDRGLKLCK